MTDPSVIKQIEQDTIDLLRDDLRDKKVTPERAHEIAHRVISSLNSRMTVKEVYYTVKNLEQQFPELKKLLFDATEEYENQIKDQILLQTEELLKEHKLDEADAVLDKAMADESALAKFIQDPFQKQVVSENPEQELENL